MTLLKENINKIISLEFSNGIHLDMYGYIKNRNINDQWQKHYGLQSQLDHHQIINKIYRA